jgi:hypothetical protein
LVVNISCLVRVIVAFSNYMTITVSLLNTGSLRLLLLWKHILGKWPRSKLQMHRPEDQNNSCCPKHPISLFLRNANQIVGDPDNPSE